MPAVTNPNQAQPRNLDDILKTVKAAHPQRTQGWTMLLPGYGADHLLVEYMKPEETRDELWAPLEILIDPYSGKIVEQALWRRTLPGVMYEIHADFYAGRIGKEIGETGFAFSYEGYIKPVVTVFSAVKKDHLKDPAVKSTVVDSMQPISIVQAADISDQVFPGTAL